ncbi:MAG: hypothetical protein HOK99_02730 [Betaproteobacteria bacterium]|nr:hypothetical protein [Betaproteobacteria bacterium]
MIFKKAAQTRFAPLFALRVMMTASLLLVGCVTNDAGMLESSCIDGNCTHPVDTLNSINISKVKFVQQIDQKGCGAATISSLLTYWDKPVSYENIVSKYPSTSTEGYNVGELKSIASKYDLAAYSLQMTEKFLKENLAKGRPIIIAVKKYIFKYARILPEFVPFKGQITYSHFLVVFGYNENGYWVMDPAEGYKYLAADTLREMWRRQKFVGLLISAKPS